MSHPRTRQERPVVEELRELRDIARREHGPNARSTRQIEACIEAEERSGSRAATEGAGVPRPDPRDR